MNFEYINKQIREFATNDGTEDQELLEQRIIAAHALIMARENSQKSIVRRTPIVEVQTTDSAAEIARSLRRELRQRPERQS